MVPGDWCHMQLGGDGSRDLGDRAMAGNESGCCIFFHAPDRSREGISGGGAQQLRVDWGRRLTAGLDVIKHHDRAGPYLKEDRQTGGDEAKEATSPSSSLPGSEARERKMYTMSLLGTQSPDLKKRRIVKRPSRYSFQEGGNGRGGDFRGRERAIRGLAGRAFVSA